MARASKYVLGLMDEDERARAERDLEHDTAFRDAMVQVAERMHLFDINKPHQGAAPALWKSITAHLGALPHIRVAGPGEVASGSKPPTATPASDPVAHDSRQRLVPGWRMSILALSLVVACGAGYAAGRLGSEAAPADCQAVAQ